MHSLHSLSPVPANQGELIARARSPFWLAPMAGITDVCFRQLMDEMRAGVLISELVSAKGLFYNSEKTRKMMRIHKSPGTIVGIQLFGESPEDIVQAVSVVEETGADFVDINMGCPVKKVVKKINSEKGLQDLFPMDNVTLRWSKNRSSSPPRQLVFDLRPKIQE